MNEAQEDSALRSCYPFYRYWESPDACEEVDEGFIADMRNDFEGDR